MSIALVIGLWINDETTFDHYAPNHNRLAAGWLNMRLNNATKKEEFFTGQTVMILAAMAPVFKKYNPSSPFIYKFVDESYASKFVAEEHIGNLAAVFAGLAIFISCLGLFGLAAFVAEQRTKEIGVRKVLGADLFSLWALLQKNF